MIVWNAFEKVYFKVEFNPCEFKSRKVDGVLFCHCLLKHGILGEMRLDLK